MIRNALKVQSCVNKAKSYFVAEPEDNSDCTFAQNVYCNTP
jgi:hypothetical protein